MWHHNAESLESMLRSDRANITIEEKNKSTKKHFEISDDFPTFFRLPMVKNHAYRLLSKSLSKKADRNFSKNNYENNSEDKDSNEKYFWKSNGNESIKEIETKEFLDNDAEEEKNSIEPGIRIRQRKLIQHLENNSDEIKKELLGKVCLKIPKLSYKMKNLTVHPEDISGKNFFFNKNSINNIDKNENSVNATNNKNLNNINGERKIAFLNKGKTDDEFFQSSSEKQNLNILDFSHEKPRKGHFRNLSNVEQQSSYPKFRESFIGGNYLKNLNDFDIAESGTAKKERILNFSFLPRKVNQSSMDELSQNIEKKYGDKVAIEAPGWSFFHEKFYTLHKLNDFAKKKTDFKNTLYKSDIHVDKPYVPQSLNKSNNSKPKLILSKDTIKEKGISYIKKISIKKIDDNCNQNSLNINSNNSNYYNHQEKEKLKESNNLKNYNSNYYNNNNKALITTKRNDSNTTFNKLTLGEKTFSNTNNNNNITTTERNGLNTLKNKQKRELRLTNLNSVQLANVNMSNTFSNNPILRISENTAMRADKKSDTEVIVSVKNFEIKKRKFEINKTNEKEKEFERNVSFNNFHPLNKEKISNIDKARKVMYDNKMSKLMDYFNQGGI